jgi:iron complex transport system substrate-binding protein
MKINKLLAIALGSVIAMTAIVGCGSTQNVEENNLVVETTESEEVSAEVVTAEDDAQDVAAEETITEQKRVIALSKSNAELWILAGGTLVATSDDALEIEGLNEDVVSLGDMDHVSLEAVTALEPDLLIVFSTDPAQKALGEAAEDIGLDVVYTNIDGYNDYMEVMKEFTDITGRNDLYEENVVNVKEAVDSVIAKVPETEEEKTYLLLHVSATKSKAEKDDYFASEIFNNLGLANVASDDSAFNELSMEAIVAADPDYIFVVPRGDEDKALASFNEIFESDPSWESLTAVKENRYYLLSKDLFGLKPNNRWGESYEEAYKILYEE